MNSTNRTVIDNVRVFTMEDETGVIEHGRVIIEDDKIISVGRSESTEPENGWLFPGFIDAHTHIGIIEDSLGFEGDDVNETGDPITPQLRGIDAINPLERSFSEARLGGVTAVMAGPGSANPIGGQFCALKTVGRRIDKMLLGEGAESAAMKFALGENPKCVYHGKSQSPETRMMTAAMIRENLKKAVKYAEAMDKAHAEPVETEDDLRDDELPDEPEYDAKNDALMPVVKGELAAHFHAHRADDIFTAIRIAKEFNLKYTIVHCTEGHLIADELAEEDGFSAIVGPVMGDRSKPELSNKEYITPKALDDAGILCAITTDHPETPLYHLPLCAMMAVKYGLDFERAMRMITINAAKIMGYDDRIGSIKPGKDADIVIYDKCPLDMTAKIEKVYINGKEITQ
nr:amidohydrolase [Clostridia bacterium]